jgi:uncharacterized protein YbjT (DUF2867 family)
MPNTILVTGATGNVGREVVTSLLKNGFKVRAGVPHPDKAKLPGGVKVVYMDYNEVSSVEDALKDVYGMFMIAPPLDAKAADKLNPTIDRAKKAGVIHIVLNSVYGADKAEGSPMRAVESYLRNSGVKYTIIRPNFFMENFTKGMTASMIRDRHEISLAAGDGKTSFITTKDIGEAVAIIFAEKHFGKEYSLTGPEALNYTQVARIIGDAIGEPVKYNKITEEQMIGAARNAGLPDDAARYLGMLYEFVRDGQASGLTTDIEQLTRHKPTSFEEFAQSHASAWKVTAKTTS